MAEISRDEVARIARLARIALNDEELDDIAKQLDTIVDAVSKVQGVDTEGVTPMSTRTPSTRACAQTWRRRR